MWLGSWPCSASRPPTTCGRVADEMAPAPLRRLRHLRDDRRHLHAAAPADEGERCDARRSSPASGPTALVGAAPQLGLSGSAPTGHPIGVLYLALGWSVLAAYDSVLPALVLLGPCPARRWAVSLYSGGVIFDVWQRLRFQNAHLARLRPRCSGPPTGAPFVYCIVLARALARDNFSSRSSRSTSLFEHDLFRKPFAFRDHASSARKGLDGGARGIGATAP